jgi:hypothetical protein
MTMDPEVRQEVAEIGPLLWRLAGLRSILYETERYVLAETLRDVADELDRGNRPQRLVLITPNGPNNRLLYRTDRWTRSGAWSLTFCPRLVR